MDQAKFDKFLEAVRQVMREHGVKTMFGLTDAVVVEFKGDKHQYIVDNYGSIEAEPSEDL